MQPIFHNFILAFNQLSRFYRAVFVLFTIVTLANVFLRPYIFSPIIKQFINYNFLLENNQLKEIILKTFLNPITSNGDKNLLKNKLNEQINENIGVHEYTVSAGDTLSSILTKYGINVTDIITLVQRYSSLRNLKIGQTISWTLNANGNLQRLTWSTSHNKIYTYERIRDSFKESIFNITGEWFNITLKGKLNDNFVTSARIAGLTVNDINDVIKALQWQLDFRKLRKGDQFIVLTSREILNGKSRQSQLLGVHLRSSGKDYYSFYADNGRFYNCDAINLAQGFMRFPTMKHFRVSSDFNPRRLNPVTGRVVPHCGVDFAVPVGTPVLSVADGEVIVSKSNNIAGNYVAIRHSCKYMTRYMHLKKILVKPGQKVKCGDRIALSGNTGRSTGPHLHFEVWINQQAVNPLTAKLPCIERLTGLDREKYLTHVRKILPKLQFN